MDLPTRQTRKTTAVYGKLSSGRSKEDMLANPIIPSSIKNPTQAKNYLVSHALLPFNEDPNHLALSKVILDIMFTCSSDMGALTADALRAVAILLEHYETPNNITTTNKQLIHQSQQMDPTLGQENAQQPPMSSSDLANQIQELQNTIRLLSDVATSNELSANLIRKTAENMTDELNTASKVISASAELIANNANSVPMPTPSSTLTPSTSGMDEQNIESALWEIKSLIRKSSSSPPLSYKDALINPSSSHPLPTAHHPSSNEHTVEGRLYYAVVMYYIQLTC